VFCNENAGHIEQFGHEPLELSKKRISSLIISFSNDGISDDVFYVYVF